MRIRGKMVGELRAEDIVSLVENRVAESRTLDYKRDLPGRKDADKRELLADVSSFANTAGGVLLFGIETERDANGADTGIPVCFKTVSVTNLDETTRWLSQVIGDGLSPSLRRLAFQPITLPTGETVLALGIPRSLDAPHAVWFEKSGKFYRRSVADKYQADVMEIRRMFSEAEEWDRAAQRFHDERVHLLTNARVGLPPLPPERTIVHVVPLGRPTGMIDFAPWRERLLSLSVPVTTSVNFRYNFDGFLVTTNTGRPSDHEAHVLWFRSGAVEIFTSQLHYTAQDRRLLVADGLHRMLTRDLQPILDFLVSTASVDPPFGVFVRLEGVERCEVGGGRVTLSWPGQHIIDRAALELPPAFIREQGQNLEVTMRPLLDVVWQSAGYSGMPKG